MKRASSRRLAAAAAARMSPVVFFFLAFFTLAPLTLPLSRYTRRSLANVTIDPCFYTRKQKTQLEALAAARAERGIAADDDDDESDGDDDDDDDDGQNPSAPSRLASARDRPPTYDAEALRDALEDIRWQPEADWAEARAVASARTDDPCPGAAVDDDLARELAFYRQALAAARAVAASADAAGVAWSRPHDFYAEMVKSDGHMQRVRAQMEHERATIEAAGAARQAREAKRFSKEVSAERRKEKAASKKQASEGIAKLRADRQRGGFSGELDADAALEALERRGGVNNVGGGGGRAGRGDDGAGRGGGGGGGFGRGRGGGGGSSSRGGGRHALGQRISRDGGAREQSGKRAFKDAKYGRGGRKRGSRQNDAASAADTRDFRPGKFTEHFSARGGGVGKGGGGGGRGGGRGGRSGGRGGGASRPGKSRRAATRGGR